MAKVTDPALLSALETSQLNINRGDGKGGFSGAENREMADARENNEKGRNVFPNLAKVYAVAARYPGGNPNAVLAKGMLGIGSNEPQYQDYKLFEKYATRAAISKAKLLGTNPTDKDFAKSYMAGATPEDRFRNNREIIGQDFSEASRNYFTNAFKQRWAARNGGLNGRDANGHTYVEDLARAMQNPNIANLMQPPWRRKGAAQAEKPAVIIHYDAQGNRIP